MKNIIHNIFMDQKSYETIMGSVNLEEVIATILDNIRTDELQHQKIIINGVVFEAEFHARNDYFGFTFTKKGYHSICYDRNKFKNSVYLYSPNVMEAYEDDFPGATILLYTSKKFVYVIPYGGKELEKMDCNTGKIEKL